ncbi:MAG TPA: beta-propeller fold lactonase family protein [Methanocella sp.]|uniref:beta-propeller fold lactonase family protein n=1 Tax=Methanocella sp. TaxID=2052833 RepID=UPI002C7D0BB3|nr:beta-propeller fold lactonase family protein [Methanocella sp.]HTY89730.1 beta-propeller fold lactonase family protein [Methanocella sp.]
MKWAILTITIAAVLILFCAGAQAEAPSPGQGFLYVGNTDERTVTIVDMQNDSVVNSMDIESQILGLAADSTGYYVYVASNDGVHIIDTKTDSSRNVGMGSSPHAIAVSPDGSGYYVLYGTYINLVRIGSGDVAQKIALPRSKDVMAISPDGSMACLGSTSFTTVGLYKMPSGESASPEIDFGKSVDCAFSPDTEFAYVSLMDQKKVIALKVHDYFIKSDIAVPSNPGGLAISPDGSTLYVTLPSDNRVVAINTSSRNIVGTIDVGGSPQHILFSPDGRKAYVSNSGSNSVSVIDTSGLPGSIGNVTKTISVGSRPVFLAIASKPALPTDTPTPTAAPRPTPTITVTPTITPSPTTAPAPTPTATPTPKPTPGFEALAAMIAMAGVVVLVNNKK